MLHGDLIIETTSEASIELFPIITSPANDVTIKIKKVVVQIWQGKEYIFIYTGVGDNFHPYRILTGGA